MNKRNKILIGCLALLLVLSVGYALFSETITINGTATAKGEMELTITEANINDLYGIEDYKGIVNSSSISIVDNVVTSNVSLGSPGSYKRILIKVENTGTIPAKLKSIEDISEKRYEESGNWFGVIKRNNDNTSYLSVEVFPDANFWDDYVYETAYSYENVPDDSIYTAVLDPGESTYYVLEYLWDEITTSQEEMSIDFKFKLNFEQVTN